MSGKVNIRRHGFVPDGGRRECFFSVEAVPGIFSDFREEFAALWDAYNAELASDGFSPDMELLLRLHLSDAANQGNEVRRVLGGRSASILDQPPASGARVSLEAWLIADAAPRRVRISYSPRPSGGDSCSQMYELFGKLAEYLDGKGGELGRNVLRTWIYCRDVDNNYAGVVRGRNRCFDEYGLCERYLASTGIGGGTDDPYQLVAMDALVCDGDVPEETPLRALENLSPTAIYGVRFERGMRIGWRDRDWLLISGTASIDRRGEILHAGDIVRQSRRVLENISALLSEGGSTTADVRAATVYLRDPAEFASVRGVFDAALPDIPLVYLRAPVCRPGWLVECECIAEVAADHPDAPLL